MQYYKGIKRRLSDQVFSRFIRLRDKRCVFRVKCYGNQNYEELACCHFHSRRKESTRFDPQNCDAGCVKCHYFIDATETGKQWFREFKLKQLGQRDFDLLQVRSETLTKRDDALMLLYSKELLSEVIADKEATPLPNPATTLLT